MTEPTLFDQTEPTVLAELERKVEALKFNAHHQWDFGYNAAVQDVLNEIDKHKPTEIDKLKQAFAEGYIQTESAESWVKKFSQGGC
jgi:hypothetical protein